MEKWHAHIKDELPGGLDELLADDCVFFSPVVFTPQRGKDLTKMYLSAAGSTFSNSNNDRDSDGEPDQAPEKTGSPFRYTKEILSGHHAVLEFESEIDGTYINGIDMISWNDAG